MLFELAKKLKLDANESTIFARELEAIESEIYEVEFPENNAKFNFNVDYKEPNWIETITYRQFEKIGFAKIVSSYADDAPRVDTYGKEFTSHVRSIVDAYGYSVQEIRASIALGRPLDREKALSAREANDQLQEKIAWLGSAEHKILGVLNNPNISAYTAPNGALVSPLWSNKTADEILKDMNDAVTFIQTSTFKRETPDRILLPLEQYRLIATMPYKASGGSDLTVLEYFLRNNKMIKEIDSDPYLEDVAPLPSGGAGPSDCMMVYSRNSRKLKFKIPQEFEQFPPQERNLESVVNCHSRNGGVIIYKPLSVLIVEGI